MNDGASVLAGALRLLDRQARRGPDAAWHPTPEELTAYRDGRLPATLRRRVEEHLSFCFDCPDLLLDLERFLEEPAGEEAQEPPEPLEAGAWLRRPERRGSRRMPRPGPLRRVHALAACLALAAAGLGLWNVSLRRDLLAARAEPAAQVELEGIRRGGSPREEPADLILRSGDRSIELLLRDGLPPGSYRIRLLREEEDVTAPVGQAHIRVQDP